ncbi:hypothetical protein D3C84_1265070 [compost metagenome]
MTGSKAGCISFQLFAELGVGDIYQAADSLSEAQAAQIGDAKFSDDQADITSRGADRSVKAGDDSAVLSGGGG